ncbi:uncharacterized protein G2W53_025854 [Senna tora]|uniref:Uncharacterized protein n=1 Tax=Senna tora TaxID=362788 RepID=A0A834WKP5_9FABA|nr:uncharacterized protein G2W53_025854 [Senna tora]
MTPLVRSCLWTSSSQTRCRLCRSHSPKAGLNPLECHEGPPKGSNMSQAVIMSEMVNQAAKKRSSLLLVWSSKTRSFRFFQTCQHTTSKPILQSLARSEPTSVLRRVGMHMVNQLTKSTNPFIMPESNLRTITKIPRGMSLNKVPRARDAFPEPNPQYHTRFFQSKREKSYPIAKPPGNGKVLNQAHFGYRD